jgi:hypothetical protein
MKLKIGDFLVFFAIICLIIYSFKIKNKFPLKYVEIITPFKTLTLPLTDNKKVTVRGKLGKFVIEIKDKKVRVISSKCAHKICIKTGWISNSNEYIACVPNGILIKLVGVKEKKIYDFITQ